MKCAGITKDTIYHKVPNGGLAILDHNSKIIAYAKLDMHQGENDWDYVRKDYRIGVDKADK